MLNRRYIRIKVFQLLYVWHADKSLSALQVHKRLNESLENLLKLEYYIISFFKSLVFEANERIDRDKAKRLPSPEDLNPNYRFVNNRLIQIWTEDPAIKKAIEKHKIKWSDHSDFVRKTLEDIKKRDHYHKYMNVSKDNFRSDKEFVLFLFKYIVSGSPDIHHAMEDLNIHWYEDINFVNARLLFFLEDLKEGDEEFYISSLYKDEESDEQFAKDLVTQTINNDAYLTELIQGKTENWETERIALVDIILMKMALVELLYFKTIPTKVSMNEYIDISKYYSTPKSKVFINGVLDKLLIELKESGEIVKQGRGLIGF
ncbi:MAG: transcription antitermination factor NusB [Flavobacteriales bacterium]|nr:transcription antitermination factor NusB [Flavobacteriales bacterium]